MNVGDIVTIDGVFIENPRYYEFNVETTDHLPLGELVFVENDDRAYRVVACSGTTARLRMMPRQQRTGDEPV